MFIQAFIGRRLDECNLRQGAIGHVAQILRNRHKVLRILSQNVMLKREHVDVALEQKAYGQATVILAPQRMYVNLPCDSVLLQELKDRLVGKQRAVGATQRKS